MGSYFYLLPDRGQLYTVYVGRAARAVGVDDFRCRVGLGDCGNDFEIVPEKHQWDQSLVGGPVSGDGVDGGVGIAAVAGFDTAGGVDVVDYGWRVVYFGHILLCLEKPAVYPCDMALFRVSGNLDACVGRFVFLCLAGLESVGPIPG